MGGGECDYGTSLPSAADVVALLADHDEAPSPGTTFEAVLQQALWDASDQFALCCRGTGRALILRSLRGDVRAWEREWVADGAWPSRVPAGPGAAAARGCGARGRGVGAGALGGAFLVCCPVLVACSCVCACVCSCTGSCSGAVAGLLCCGSWFAAACVPRFAWGPCPYLLQVGACVTTRGRAPAVVPV